MQKIVIAGLLFLGLAFAVQLPQQFEGVAQHFGYINVNQSANANMFYWMFESQGNPSTDPLVLWMTGGPGCSSELALFFENGPFWVDASGNLHNNPYSWNTNANLLYVDQPIGTGFSYADSDYVDNEAGVDQDMWILLTKFLALYPQYAKLDFYIVGESYGGHYVPSVAAYIVQQNQISTNPFINLKGIGVGNGWVNPKVQYGAYGPFAYSVGLIDANTYAQMNQTYAQCVQDLNNQDWNDAGNDCGSLLETVLQEAGNINVYNYKLPCNPPPLCYDFSNITNYLNTPSVQQALGVNNIQWQTCSDSVNELFGVDREESFAFDVPLLLNAGMRVLIYSGKLDLICNYFGLEWVEEINWNGKTPFNHLPMVPWILNGKNVAQFKSLQNLTKMQINDAGHMVPYDRPAIALQMLNFFLNDYPF